MARTHVLSQVETGRLPHWGAAAWSGILGGVIFLVLEMLLVAAAGGSIWGPPRMMAAILMGQDVLPPPATFSLGVFVIGMIVHFVLAAVYGLIAGLLVFRLETWAAVLVGALFGLLLYLINFYVFTAAYPWFAEARSGITVFAHLAFGASTAWLYKGLVHRQVTHRNAVH